MWVRDQCAIRSTRGNLKLLTLTCLITEKRNKLLTSTKTFNCASWLLPVFIQYNYYHFFFKYKCNRSYIALCLTFSPINHTNIFILLMIIIIIPTYINKVSWHKTIDLGSAIFHNHKRFYSFWLQSKYFSSVEKHCFR